jgi:hypothetical protein
MLPPFLGQLLTVATGGVLVGGLLLAVLGGMRGSWFLVRLAGVTTGAAVAVYGAFFGAGLLLAKDRVLAPGEAVRFCGLDCHLHVQVSGARAGEVVVRFSSNAVRAPEWPELLAFSLVDAQGRRYPVRNEIPHRPVGPEESWEHTLEFPAGVNPTGATLEVTWKNKLDYLVPGAGNPLVQRHTRLALPGRTPL